MSHTTFWNERPDPPIRWGWIAAVTLGVLIALWLLQGDTRPF